MLKKATLALLGVLCFALNVIDLKAVTFGEPDGNAHPYVGTILFQTPSGFFSCTGTLLSPTVMVTAGHCTQEGGQVNLATWVSFDPVITFAGIEDYPDPIAYLNAKWITAQAIPHPLYDDFNAFPNTYDVGVLVLSKPVVLSTYGALPPLGLLEFLSTGQARKDRRFTIVGYGLQGAIRPFFQDDYARYSATVSLIEVNSFLLGDDQSAKFTGSPGKGVGPGGGCFGDSGGPLLWGNSNIIGAITSFGNSVCMGAGYYFRLDTAVAQDFITEYLRSNQPL